ncbi:MAG TPA: ABC transporter substrate-binding protein [Acidimicrobiia bacterium]|nr:ABC transporter substrate-binding protein [Acidimicrobiia bacterium]
MVAAGCTSTTSEGDGSDSSSGGVGSAVGITDNTIKISMVAADLSTLTEQNLAPDIGDPAKTMEAVVADVNANGGVAGRQIELTTHILSGTDAVLNPDAARQACVQATEDDQPFAVIISAAISADVVECTAIDHDVLTITMDSWPDSFFEEAEGRLFSVATHLSMSRTREYDAWPELLDDEGQLDGKTIGIVRQDIPTQQEAVDDSLTPSLEALGYEVAAESVLPCPEGSQTCEQHDVAIQRLQDAGVDLVFLVAQTLPGAATVDAAAKLGFTPEWTTIGNNVTNTVAKFYTNAKENYDGAWGINTAFSEPTDTAVECNRIAVAGDALEFPFASDGYLFTAVTCQQLQTLATAIDDIDGTITQASAIKALENLGDVPMIAGPPLGTLSTTKHDAGNSVFLSRYDASTEVFEPIDDEKPTEIK